MDSPSWTGGLDDISRELGKWHQENSKSRIDSLAGPLEMPNGGNLHSPLSPDEALDKPLFGVTSHNNSGKTTNMEEENAMV